MTSKNSGAGGGAAEGDVAELLHLAETLGAEDLAVCARVIEHVSILEKSRGPDATLLLLEKAIRAANASRQES